MTICESFAASAIPNLLGSFAVMPWWEEYTPRMETEEFAHDPRDDIYPPPTPTPFNRDQTAPSLDDLNATPHPEVAVAEPEEEPETNGPAPPGPESVAEPVVAPLSEPDAPVVAPSTPARKTRPTGNTPSERHIEALLLLAAFYDEHPDAYVPGGEHFSTAQAFLERMMNLGGEWEFDVHQDEFVIRLVGMPDRLGPHLHCAAKLLAAQWLDDIGVHSAP